MLNELMFKEHKIDVPAFITIPLENTAVFRIIRFKGIINKDEVVYYYYLM